MPKKRDPVIAVLRYFQDADLTLAQQALTLCKATVAHRVARETREGLRPAPLARPARRPAGGAAPAVETE